MTPIPAELFLDFVLDLERGWDSARLANGRSLSNALLVGLPTPNPTPAPSPALMVVLVLELPLRLALALVPPFEYP